MKRLMAVVALLAAAWSMSSAGTAGISEPMRTTLSGSGDTLHYAPTDSAAAQRVARAVERGRARVVRFFGGRFVRPFAVRIMPSRAVLDAWWQQAWHAPAFRSECWMVASGTASELDVLSPRAWASDACEHDAADSGHVDRLIAHELVHVYHGQHSPKRELDGMDDLGWFVEGVAVLASGQLDHEFMNSARDAWAHGAMPDSLSRAWSGRYRYGVSGSLVRVVDRRVGRRMLARMLADTTQAQLLRHTGLTERELLTRWRESVVEAPERRSRHGSARDSAR